MKFAGATVMGNILELPLADLGPVVVGLRSAPLQPHALLQSGR